MYDDKRNSCLVIEYDKYRQMKEDINKFIYADCRSCFNIDGLFNILDKYINPDSINKKYQNDNSYWHCGAIGTFTK